ncbi:hypothetical protein B0T16DRAFT_389591 [Cercophora newfieldiana]|uniref:Transmembrane protein n=1 Tax=Cercophora newfieldiana TaxID=92897 RepID=A0AA39YBG4_9PEZI|nr:hypothetical protein B0T16DRAFT_389591 [Cercophora newfieldiana]
MRFQAMRLHAICLSVFLGASLCAAQETITQTQTHTFSTLTQTPAPSLQTVTQNGPTTGLAALDVITATSTVQVTVSPEAFIGWKAVVDIERAASTTKIEVKEYLGLYCAAPATYTFANGFAACCTGPCVIPSRCTSVYHTDTPTDTTDLGRITCTYTEFRQTSFGVEWASCATTGIYAYPTGAPKDSVVMMLGCDAEVNLPYASRFDIINSFPDTLLYRELQAPKPPIDKSAIVAIALVVPMAAITAVIAAWCHWRRRAKRRAERQKNALPGYVDCILEGRPPAYSPSPESGPDGEEAGRESRPRSPPPDYAASTENLPGRHRHEPARATEERELGLEAGQESYVLQELDRTAVDELRRGQENTEPRGTESPGPTVGRTRESTAPDRERT